MPWKIRYCSGVIALPDLATDESDDEAIVTAVEVQEQLGQFKTITIGETLMKSDK